MKLQKKAVFFDIDGTLWDEYFVIPQSTRDAIRQLRENGHYAFLCSGRTRAFIQDEKLLSLGFDGIIAGCGTMIEYQNDTLFYKKLEQSLIQKVTALLRKYRIPAVLEGRYHLYMEHEAFEGDTYEKRMEEAMGEKLLPIQDSEEIEISKFSCTSLTSGRDEIMKILADDFDVLIHDSRCAEFVPKGFSKASGIAKTCELLGIDQEDTYAFGDSVNDIEMLKYVRHGIVMGNGTKAAKDAGDYITASLYEDGIQKGMKHFALI